MASGAIGKPDSASVFSVSTKSRLPRCSLKTVFDTLMLAAGAADAAGEGHRALDAAARPVEAKRS
eukprot:3937988-Pleurochrysis_carterae.AAC.2